MNHNEADASWLKFLRLLDARHFDLVRPTLTFRTAKDSACSLFSNPYTKHRDAPYGIAGLCRDASQ
jgi:hypothetical protein